MPFTRSPGIELRRAFAGIFVLALGAITAVVLMLEKTTNYALLGIGTGLAEAVGVGVAIMAPGLALMLYAVLPPSESVADAEAFGSAKSLSRLSSKNRVFFGLLTVVAAIAIVAVVRLTFGVTGPMGTMGLPISLPLEDLFHEGEIIGSIGLFQDGVSSELPLLIHGPGRNLLPAWLALQMGETDNMIAEMRFVTATGRFYVATITAIASTAVAVLVARMQTLIKLEWIECLALGVVAASAAVAFITIVGRITNREVAVSTASLLGILMIWAAGAGRNKAAAFLAGILGMLVFLSPLHTYLGAIQSVGIGIAAVSIAAWCSPAKAISLVWSVCLGIGFALGLVVLAGLSNLWITSLESILYWSRSGGELWGRNVSIPALLTTMFFAAAAATLGGLALGGSRLGLEDRSARGVLALSCVITVASVLSFSNRPIIGGQVGHAFVIAAPALAAIMMIVLGILRYLSFQRTILAACLIAAIAMTRAVSLEGNTLSDALAQISTSDETIIQPDTLAFYDEFRSELDQLDCLLILSNEGALAYVHRLPPCGPTFYPIYSNSEGDSELADWLRSNPQELIISRSDSYWYSIDGRPMSERLPKTYEVVEDLYPVSRVFKIWEIRFPKRTQ